MKFFKLQKVTVNISEDYQNLSKYFKFNDSLIENGKPVTVILNIDCSFISFSSQNDHEKPVIIFHNHFDYEKSKLHYKITLLCYIIFAYIF